MPRFKAKSIEINAIQYWTPGDERHKTIPNLLEAGERIEIRVGGGYLRVSPGDWVIRFESDEGTEIQVCDENIFDLRYELIPDPVLKYGDPCRAECGAPARYVRDGICLFVSSMDGTNLCSGKALPARGDEHDKVLPSDDGLQGFSIGLASRASSLCERRVV